MYKEHKNKAHKTNYENPNNKAIRNRLFFGLSILIFLYLGNPAMAVDPLIVSNTAYNFDNHEIVLSPIPSLSAHVPNGFKILEVSPGLGSVLFVTINATSPFIGSYQALYALIAVDQYETAPEGTMSFYLAKVYTDNLYYKYFLDSFSNVTDVATFEINRVAEDGIINDVVIIKDNYGEIFKLNSTSNIIVPQNISLNIYRTINDGLITLQLNRNHTKIVAPGPGQVELRENTILWDIVGGTASPAVITSWSTIDIKEVQSLYIVSQKNKNVTDAAVDWLKTHQSVDGSWFEYVPFTSVSVISLLNSNSSERSLLANRGINWLINNQRADGSWPRVTRMPIWDTEFAMIAISEAGKDNSHIIKKASEWLLLAQQKDGGFSWDNLPGMTSDVDDTAYGLVSLNYSGVEPDSLEIKAAQKKLLDSQNTDGGWPAWIKGGNGIDASHVDLTAHAIEGLTATGFSPYSVEIQNGAKWIEQQQLPEGNWGGIWYRNYTYTTMTGIIGLHSAGRPASSQYIQKAVTWIKQNQNQDGGWGGQKGINSSSEETSWALYALLIAGDNPKSPEIQKGIKWLLNNQEVKGKWKSKNALEKHGSEIKQNSGVWEPQYVAVGGTGLGYYDTLLPTTSALRALAKYRSISNDKQVDPVIKSSINYLKKEQLKEGYWLGYIPSHADATGLAVLALMSYGFDENSTQVKKAVNWLIKNQKQDGGWVTGDPIAPSDIDATSVILLVLIKNNAPEDVINKARNFTISQGGYSKATWSKSLLAMDGMISWDQAKIPLPLEIIYSEKLFVQFVPLVYQYHFVPLQLINYEYMNQSQNNLE